MCSNHYILIEPLIFTKKATCNISFFRHDSTTLSWDSHFRNLTWQCPITASCFWHWDFHCLSPVISPTKETGTFSLSQIPCSICLSSARTSKALLSWYSAPHSSNTEMVGSPRMKSFTRMTAPAGSDISFSTFPEVTRGTTIGYTILEVTSLLKCCRFVSWGSSHHLMTPTTMMIGALCSWKV